jgi:hypothetical protein
MNVFVVTQSLFNTEVIAVKSTECKAKEYIKELEAQGKGKASYSYEEFTID